MRQQRWSVSTSAETYRLIGVVAKRRGMSRAKFVELVMADACGCCDCVAEKAGI